MRDNALQDVFSTVARSAICLSVDSLHLGFLGPYGNGWIETPAFDHLAAESIVFDRFYVETLDPDRRLDSRSAFRRIAKYLADAGIATVLLTDDADLFESIATEEAETPTGIFRERVLVELPKAKTPVAATEQTHLYRMIAETVRIAERYAEKGTTEPFFLWTHLCGLAKFWDFPIDLRRRFQAEGDPEPYVGTDVPYFSVERDSFAPSSGEIIDPDLLQSIIEAYAGGIAVLDEALGGLLDSLEERELGKNTLFALTSIRGFPMGEHCVIGWPMINQDDRAKQQHDEALYFSEIVHIPFFLQFPHSGQSLYSAWRIPEIASIPDIFVTFIDWFALSPDFLYKTTDSDATQSGTTSFSLMPLLLEDVEQLHEDIEIDNKLLITRDWFLRCTSQIELYVKPDDAWEVNDVATRCAETVQELLERRSRPAP